MGQDGTGRDSPPLPGSTTAFPKGPGASPSSAPTQPHPPHFQAVLLGLDEVRRIPGHVACTPQPSQALLARFRPPEPHVALAGTLLNLVV